MILSNIYRNKDYRKYKQLLLNIFEILENEMGRTKYSRKPKLANQSKPQSLILVTFLLAVKSSGQDLRVSFKNTYETANILKGMELLRAMDYLN